MHSNLSAESAGEAQGLDAEGQGPAGEQPRDRILEVEDAGLEGGQEGVAQDPPGMKQERDKEEAHPAKAEPVSVKQEEAEGSELEGSQDRPSIAIFGEEIAAESDVKHEDDPQLREDQAGATISIASASASVQDRDARGQVVPATKESPAQQDGVQNPISNDVVNHVTEHVTSDSGTANQQPPAVNTFAVLCRENGMLQIFSLPDMQLLFSYSNPIEGPPLLTPGGSSPPQPEEGGANVRVVEACMESFGARDASGDYFVANDDWPCHVTQ